MPKYHVNVDRHTFISVSDFLELPMGARLRECQELIPSEEMPDIMGEAAVLHPLYFRNTRSPFEAACKKEEDKAKAKKAQTASRYK